MHGEVLLVILILVFGWAACLFGVIYFVVRLVSLLGRKVLGVFKPDPLTSVPGQSMVGARRSICSRELCRKVEYRDARYCSQCGAPLT